MATALVNAGADPNARDHTLQRPLDYAQSNFVLKNTEAYAQLSDATTSIRIDDMVETWTKLGSLILWGIAAIAGLGIWGLFSLPVSPRMVYAGSIATNLLAGILGYLAPDWAVALSGNQPMDASLANLMALSMESRVTATWITCGVAGSVYWLLFRERLSRRAHIAGANATILIVVIVSYCDTNWLPLFG